MSCVTLVLLWGHRGGSPSTNKISTFQTWRPTSKDGGGRSCWTETDRQEDYDLVRACRQTDGSFKESESCMSMCFIYSAERRIQQVSQQIARRDYFISTLGTAADRPDGRRGVHHLMAHLSEEKKKEHCERWVNPPPPKELHYSPSQAYLCKLCRVVEGDATGGRGPLARMILQHTER